MTRERILAAHHEAGHAVAAVMRGGSTLTTVTLSARHGEGITWANHKPADLAFFAWAGPWAEARHQWDRESPAGEDDDGATLDDYITGVLLTQPGDMAVVVAEEDALTERLGADLARADLVNADSDIETAWPCSTIPRSPTSSGSRSGRSRPA